MKQGNKKIETIVKKLSSTDKLIIKVLEKHKVMKTADFKRETQLSVREIRTSLKKLKKINIVRSDPDLQDLRERIYVYTGK